MFHLVKVESDLLCFRETIGRIFLLQGKKKKNASLVTVSEGVLMMVVFIMIRIIVMWITYNEYYETNDIHLLDGE